MFENKKQLKNQRRNKKISPNRQKFGLKICRTGAFKYFKCSRNFLIGSYWNYWNWNIMEYNVVIGLEYNVVLIYNKMVIKGVPNCQRIQFYNLAIKPKIVLISYKNPIKLNNSTIKCLQPGLSVYE